MFKRVVIAAAIASGIAAPAHAGPVFVLNDPGGVGEGTLARAGFEAAAALWASVYADDVVVRIDVGFRRLSTGTLGSTSSLAGSVDYSVLRNAIGNDAKSADDSAAVASLGNTLSFLSNESGNCTTRVNCMPASISTRELDNDNTRDNNVLTVSNANRKALGLLTDSGARDASITFNDYYKWDFDLTNGVSKGFYDFVGVAAHEIGHALGFISGVDSADSYVTYGSSGLDNSAWGWTFDLFRYTGTQRDWTVGGTPCASADGGLSCIGLLATGRTNGDKRQASHWKDNKGLGLLDPTAPSGRVLTLSAQDVRALDLVGWDVPTFGSNTGFVSWTAVESFGTDDVLLSEELLAVPGPSGLALIALGLGALPFARRRARAS